MKCTDCGKHVRPIVAVDLDGTLGKYHEHFWEFAQQYLNLALPGAYPGGMEYHEWLGLELNVYREVKLAYRQGGGKRMMPVFSDAPSFMANMRMLDVEVWITTTRPYNRFDSTDPDTRHWLTRQGFEYDGLLYDEDKYAKLAEAVDPSRVIAVVDDLAVQYDAAQEEFGDVALQVWRQSNLNDRRNAGATSLGLIAADIIRRARVWEQTHG